MIYDKPPWCFINIYIFFKFHSVGALKTPRDPMGTLILNKLPCFCEQYKLVRQRGMLLRFLI